MSLQLACVTAAYRRRPVFENVDLRLRPGDLAGLIGPNGAGKTTLLRVAAGLIRPVVGDVLRDGPVMYFGGEQTLPGVCRADRWGRLFGVASASRRRMGQLSRGTRQLAGLAAALERDDWAIGLLDEPWEGLDPNGARWLSDLLRRHRDRGAAILISSHRLHDAADVCSRYSFLYKGVLRSATLADIARGHARVGAADLARAFDEFTRR